MKKIIIVHTDQYFVDLCGWFQREKTCLDDQKESHSKAMDTTKLCSELAMQKKLYYILWNEEHYCCVYLHVLFINVVAELYLSEENFAIW